MKITCTVNEFAKMVRRCNTVGCYNCVLCDICGDTPGVEQFVFSECIIPEIKDGEKHEE